MSLTAKICSPYVPGVGRRAAPSGPSSDECATNERIDNVRLIPLRAAEIAHIPGAFALAAGPMRPRAAVERWKLWQNGRTLRVKFLDGLASVQQKVVAIAKEWETLTNLKLDFGQAGSADIRISFAEKGFSWSTVGTDAQTVPADEPTMNYGWLEPNTSESEYERVVRHEFGHALGMIHEHQNPAALGQIPWDKAKVYAYYAQQGWSQADVDSNIFEVYAENSTNHTSFDPKSIMEYAVPDSLTIGSYAIGWNSEFSALDREFMGRQYPKSAPRAELTLVVDGERAVADLAAAGEVDSYHFEVAAVGTYIATTEGPSDTVLTLHGPNDRGAMLAWDDDRGKGANARIVRKLQPGSYWLSVRHKGNEGAYDIGVKARREHL